MSWKLDDLENKKEPKEENKPKPKKPHTKKESTFLVIGIIALAFGGLMLGYAWPYLVSLNLNGLVIDHYFMMFWVFVLAIGIFLVSVVNLALRLRGSKSQWVTSV